MHSVRATTMTWVVVSRRRAKNKKLHFCVWCARIDILRQPLQ